MKQFAASILFICINFLFSASSRGHSIDSVKPNQIRGPLSVFASNPRYFTDGSGKPIYLTGSHTWTNLVDTDTTDPPEPFDYPKYLIFLQQHNHNFIRMWAWDSPQSRQGNRIKYSSPLPWPRTGPGNALDGKLKFDLHQFNRVYFDRLRSRIVAAREKGIYVSVMLFEGWGLADDEKKHNDSWTWHPFNIRNNINGISADTNGDGKGYEFYTQSVPHDVKNIQKAYIRKIVDTVNDLDNVLYEIANEATPASVSWQYEMINYLKRYETTKPKQHSIGMTTPYWNLNNDDLFNSSADWISPAYLPDENYRDNPPSAVGRKVIILDTDHLWGIGGDRAWVWKSFLRGYNPIYMDRFDSAYWRKSLWNPEDARKAMGYTHIYAQKVNLKDMSPHDDLTSTTYCLANPGSEYLIYKPTRRNPIKLFFTVDLKAGKYRYEWFNPESGMVVSSGSFHAADGKKFFTPPFIGDAVLYIYHSEQ